MWGAAIRIRQYRTSKYLKGFVWFRCAESGLLTTLALSSGNKHATKGIVEEAVGLLDNLSAVLGVKALLFYVLRKHCWFCQTIGQQEQDACTEGTTPSQTMNEVRKFLPSQKYPHIPNVDSCLTFASLVLELWHYIASKKGN